MTDAERRAERDRLTAEAIRTVRALDRIGDELRVLCGSRTSDAAPVAPRWNAEGLAWAVRSRVMPFTVGAEPRILTEEQWAALTAPVV